MLKDNHVWATGSISSAIAACRRVSGFSLKIEVEVRTEWEAKEAIEAGADIVMLDNFAPLEMKVLAEDLKETYLGKCNFLLEASGGLNEDNCVDYFGTGVDILSFGSLSQSVPHVDFSMKIQSSKHCTSQKTD